MGVREARRRSPGTRHQYRGRTGIERPLTLSRPSIVLIAERLAVLVGTREVILTPTQFRLFEVLVAEPGRTFSRTELVEKGIGDLVSERTVDAHIKALRQKLSLDKSQLDTVRRRGYRYNLHPPVAS
jgi:DNA-binding response OmpR family regulator